MVRLNETVAHYDRFQCVSRWGFTFTAITSPANVLDAIVIRSPQNCDCWSPKKSFSARSLEEHIEFINKNKLEKAMIISEDISFITQCPTLKYLQIVPADTAKDGFDYSPLYAMPNIEYLFCVTEYGGVSGGKSTSINYADLITLKKMRVEGNGHMNYQRLISLDKLELANNKEYEDLLMFGENVRIRDISLSHCGVKSLKGINKFQNLQRMGINYCRFLQDVSELGEIKSSLRALSIEKCPKIMDFSFLKELEELEHLSLIGSNKLSDLKFLEKMKKLKTFMFSMEVESGDLSPCIQIPYVSCLKNKKSYNLNDKELPKRRPAEPFKIS